MTAILTPESAPDDAQAPRRPSLSPSRAADFKTCPLLYRFRTIDRLPERKSLAAVRGTLVHSVLEKLYDLPPAERTVAGALELVEPAWAELRDEPGVADLFGTAQDDGAETDLNAPGSVHPCRPSPGTLSRSTSRSKIRRASSPTAARSWSRSPSPTACCCAGTSTGSTSPPTALCEWSTTR